LAASSGVDVVVWKYGLIMVIILAVLGVLSIPLQSLLNQQIQVRRTEPTPAPPAETPPAETTPRPQNAPQRIAQAISLAPNGTFETERFLQAAEIHIYRFSADPTAQPLQLALQVNTSSGITATLLDPKGQAVSRGTRITHDLQEAGEYQVQLQGGRGQYQLRLELIALATSPASPSPSPTEEKEEDLNPTLPRIPR
jgi:hypothetical protein